MCGRLDLGFFGIAARFFTGIRDLREDMTEAVQRFFFVHWSRRSRACCRFSREFATLKRKYPSPNSPKAVPESAAPPACSRSASASGFDFHPVCFTLGKT